MLSQAHRYRPDYAVPPGWVLEERLEAEGIPHAEFARRCDLSTNANSRRTPGFGLLE